MSPSLRNPAEGTGQIERAAEIISNAENPIILAGNGVVRAKASEALAHFSETLGIPVANTFMAKGVIPNAHPLSLGTVGLQAHDYVACGFDRADLVICVGYDMIEYHPHLWHKNSDSQIIHIDAMPADVDTHYQLATGVLGDINAGLEEISKLTGAHQTNKFETLRDTLSDVMEEHAHDESFPVKPQKILWDLREAMNKEDILISDVGAHKMWVARMFQAEQANTCIVSNGFASMGIGVPGAVAAKLVHPERNIVTVTGDAGFLMNSQEIETAMRLNLPIVILVWNDGEYGLIKWHQQRTFGRESNIRFNNPDLVAYAKSFGAKGYRIESTDQLLPTLKQAFEDNTVVVIDCPVDYRENMKLTEQLGELVCPI